MGRGAYGTGAHPPNLRDSRIARPLSEGRCVTYSPPVASERRAPLPDPVRPQDLRLRKRRVLAGVGIGIAGNLGLTLAVVALVAALRRPQEALLDGAAAMTLSALFVVANLGGIVLLALSGRREWALGIALADVVLVAGSVGFFLWVVSSIGPC